jgi:hypothetical protein
MLDAGFSPFRPGTHLVVLIVAFDRSAPRGQQG